ncbi:alpha/beta hydrolase domain-containing protein [Kutzneria sp. CA-103260]|uniref:alpha/beta hydrolase domain-containing protein n=1 Tax=Kutzneria sp. CA-103260 TaxID=2802641 RepID=UPI00201359CE|nr:alpha/beta hydrolase domain-containing protein [Kutzneria sp. CA-103260]
MVTLAPAASAAEGPQVSGPVTGGRLGIPFNSSPVPLGAAGYTEQEYFFGGTATGYAQSGTWTGDGRWSVTPAEQAPYETRMLVRRPADPARFNGTVVVEWLNVTAGIDLDPDFQYENEELLRAGYAWVGVSAQQLGVDALKKIDPGRYGTLNHPGDTFSYDIFSQAAQALRHPQGADPLQGLKPKALIADGESQSAFRMVTYANAIQPVQRLYDGFLIHSRRDAGAPINLNQLSPAAWTRTDSGVPVLTVQTETDVLAPLNYFPAAQPDNPRFRLWEIPGTSHVDAHVQQLGQVEIQRFFPGITLPQCGLPPNDGQERYVMDAALAHLNAWVRYGAAPPEADRITITGTPPAMVRDQYGNAEGGIRTPALQAPAATLTGTGNTGDSLQCTLEGTTVPFTPEQLARLYPTNADYVAAVGRAAAQAVVKGFLLPADAAEIVRDAVH